MGHLYERGQKTFEEISSLDIFNIYDSEKHFGHLECSQILRLKYGEKTGPMKGSDQ
jgi:hypothetical protein